jgi:hypothetical protein
LSVVAAGAPTIIDQSSKDGMNLSDNGHINGSYRNCTMAIAARWP